MGRRKLTNKQVVDIANSYANDSDAVNIEYLSLRYGVSKSTISRYLHFAIRECLVTEKVAKLIAEKAIRHENTKREELGYKTSNKVSNFYENLLLDYKERKQQQENISELKEEFSRLENDYIALKHLVDTYDNIYSSSDEFPYTKQQLIDKVDNISDRMETIASILK